MTTTSIPSPDPGSFLIAALTAFMAKSTASSRVMSQPLLKAALDGRLREEIAMIIAELKTAMFLTGARTVQELALVPRVYGPRLRNWIEQRRLTC